jgi:hypothetical protein
MKEQPDGSAKAAAVAAQRAADAASAAAQAARAAAEAARAAARAAGAAERQGGGGQQPEPRRPKPSFSWAGALKDLRDKYTSVELQHEISKRRVDEE